MKEVEDAGAVVAVRVVEPLDTGTGKLDQPVVARADALGSVTKVREQGEEHAGVAIAQIAYLQRFQKLRHVLFTADQGGDDHHGTVTAWYAVGEVQARQCPGGHGDGYQDMDDRNDQRRSPDDAYDREEDEAPDALVDARYVDEEESHGQQDKEHDGSQVKEQPERTCRARGADKQRGLGVHSPFQDRSALVDEVVADVGGAIAYAGFLGGGQGERDGRPRHLQFAVSAAALHRLDSMPVAVACGEIL